jgi:parallel beta-helix repeat protein
VRRTPEFSRRARVGVLAATVATTLAGVTMIRPPAAGAAPTTVFVDKANTACTDAGSGTASAPFCTIRQAALVAVAGQTVSVAPGTYGGDIRPARSGTSAAPITYVPSGGPVTIQGGSNGFRLSGRSFITIGLFTITGTAANGIDLSSSSSIVLVANRVTNAGQPVDGRTAYGFGMDGASGCVLIWNTADHNSDAGFRLDSGSNTNLVVANAAHDNARGYVRAAAGFDVRNSTGNVLVNNVSHDNEDTGFNVWTGSSGTKLTNSVSYRNGDHGIDVHNASGAVVVANTVYGNVDSGIEVTTSTSTTIANNISADNGINSPRTSGNLRVDAPSAGGTSVDDDLLFLRVSGVMVDWAGKQYSSLAAFQTAIGKETHGRQADPRFVGASSANFRLRSDSAAIDGANSGAPSQPGNDAAGATRFDDPATPNTGRGPISYADRGAFEYRP